MGVLFVCKGNYIRSQVAAALYNKLTGTEDASSAGTYVGATDEPEGQHLPDVLPREYFEFMQGKGLDFAHGITRKLTPELLASSDVVVSMAEEPYIPEFLRSDKRVIWWDVPNPLVDSVDVWQSTYDLIKKRTQELVHT